MNMPVQETVEKLRRNLASVFFGKPQVIEQVLVALFAQGNLLLEDVPGVGKTTLAKALACSIDATFHRLQFTPDLLPTDILGGSLFNPRSGEFSFRRGPIFCNVLLADEINRASPRTQAALLEAMTEQQVTVEGRTYPLEPPFVVLATQNPVEYHGTYPLPEAQLDRFIMQLSLGYPDRTTEVDILFDQQQSHPLSRIRPVVSQEEVVALQQAVREVGVERSVADYAVALVSATREEEGLRLGASPRASLMLFRAAQALALIRGRDFVVPDDIRELALPVLVHRVVPDARTGYGNGGRAELLQALVERTPVPA